MWEYGVNNLIAKWLQHIKLFFYHLPRSTIWRAVIVFWAVDSCFNYVNRSD